MAKRKSNSTEGAIPAVTIVTTDVIKSKTNTSKPPSVKWSFPHRSLEDALKIVSAIRQYNGGNPWPPGDVAKAIGSKPKSSDFFYWTAAARDYGLTEGTREALDIRLTELGRGIAYAPNPEEEWGAKLEAFNSIKVFKDVYDYYGGSNLPEIKYLSNTLESNFGLDPRIHEEFITIFKENCNYLEISNGQTITRTNGSVASLPTRVIASPVSKRGEQHVLFVALPFVEKNVDRADGFFSEVLNNLIIPAASECGFKVQTANRSGSDIIQSTIINDLMDADIVLADLTDHNPNVLFELGFRIALNKKVIIIKTKGTPAIFDIDSMMRYYEYNGNLWKSTLENDVPKLKEHIEATWKDTKQKSYIEILTSSKH